MLEIYGLRVKFDGFDRPLRVWWKLKSDRENVMQTSYRITIDDVFDSGVVASADSVAVRISPSPEPEKEYTLNLCVCDNKGESATASVQFVTPLKTFSAVLITVSANPAPPCFKVYKNFVLKKRPSAATLYATAHGLYFAEVNGVRAGCDRLAPFWTSYNKMLQYQSYPVGLKEGENTLALTVGKGWYNGTVGFHHGTNTYGTVCAVAAELHITFEDGSCTVISTGPDWSGSESCIRDSEFFDGEVCDYTAPRAAYAVETVEESGNIVPQMSPPVRVIGELEPVAEHISPSGQRILDFGKNIVGVVQIDAKDFAGTVKLRHAEVLDMDGELYTANLRGAKSEDTFVFDGNQGIVSPQFTFHGFRYVGVEGGDGLPLGAFRALILMSDLEETGNIVTSDRRVNKLIDNIKRSQRGNFVDVPTDCPQRDERCGWTGDANVFAVSACYNYDCSLFFEKWLKDLANDQGDDGSVPMVVPDILNSRSTSAVWADVAVMLPLKLYRIYGDKTVLESQYDSMKRYVDLKLSRIGGSGLIDSGYEFGDWLALDRDELMPVSGPGSTDSYFVSNAYFTVVLGDMAEAAFATGRAEEGKYYVSRREDLISAMRREYFTATGRMACETQTACALAIALGIVPPQFKERVSSALCRNVKNHGNRLTTGFAGTPFLLFALSEGGNHALAAKLLLSRSYPGWLYAVDKGATTVWERWNGILPDGSFSDPSMNSFNHYSNGSVIEFIYRGIAGINCESAGFKKIVLSPRPAKGLTSVKAKYESVYGTIECGYVYSDGRVKIDVAVPCNTTAHIVLPDGREFEVGSGIYAYECVSVDLTAEPVTADMLIGDALNDEFIGPVLRAVGGDLFKSPQVFALKRMTFSRAGESLGEGGAQTIQKIIAKVNDIINAQ